eukprot:308153-Chlamydomonas_euryale.AAC.3
MWPSQRGADSAADPKRRGLCGSSETVWIVWPFRNSVDGGRWVGGDFGCFPVILLRALTAAHLFIKHLVLLLLDRAHLLQIARQPRRCRLGARRRSARCNGRLIVRQRCRKR